MIFLFETKFFLYETKKDLSEPMAWTVLEACRKLGVWPEAPNAWIEAALESHLKETKEQAEAWQEESFKEKRWKDAAAFLLEKEPAARRHLFLQEIRTYLLTSLTESLDFALGEVLEPSPNLLDPDTLSAPSRASTPL